MRILVFSHEYPPVGGGGGRVAQDLCEGLVRRGHAARVITAHCGGLPEHEILNGVEVFRLDSGRKEAYRASLKAMAGYVWAAFWSGWKMIRAWKPDVLHIHFAVPAGAVGWALHLLTGVPYVLTAHLGDVPGGTPEKTGKWFRWVYPFTPPIWRSAAKVVAVSSFTRQLALERYPVPMDVIFNGVDLQALDPGEICAHPVPRVVFAGRLMDQKNPVTLVRALSEARDLPWTCALMGDGPLKPEVEAEIDRLGLRERFELPGWVTPAEVLKEFARADILCMPSRTEGLPVVGVQALAMGLALVVSRAGGWSDLVEEGRSGFQADAEDAAGFAAALRALLSDPEKLLSFRRASRELASKFDLQLTLSKYENVLEESIHR